MHPMKIKAYNSISSLGNDIIISMRNLFREDFESLTMGGELTSISSNFSEKYLGIIDSEFDSQIDGRLRPQTDRSTKMALYASNKIFLDMGLSSMRDDERGAIGIVTSTAFGGFAFGERELGNLWRKGPEHVSAYQSFAWFYAVNTGQLSIANGITGSGAAVVDDEIGSAPALLVASSMLTQDSMDGVLVGATDSYLCPLGLSSVDPDTLQSDSAIAYHPFGGKGNSIGEGAAFIYVESSSDETRDDSVLIKSVRMCQIHEDGEYSTYMKRIIYDCLEDSNIDIPEITTVLPNAQGEVVADDLEAELLQNIFGKNWRSLVSIPKIKTGRLGAATLMNDVVFAAAALDRSVLLPRYWKSFTQNNREVSDKNILILGRGQAGQLAAVIVGRN